MRRNAKPVRKCHSCLLNLGDHCWLYKSPRDQWRERRTCPALDDESVKAQFRTWSKQPTVKTRQDLRRQFFRTTRKKAYRAPRGSRSGAKEARP